MGLYYNKRAIERHMPHTQVIKAGACSVAAITSNAWRVPSTGKRNAYMWLGTASTGTGGLICEIKSGSTVKATVSVLLTAANTPVAAAATFDVTEGDVLTWNITQVGGTVAGSDLSVQIVGA